MTITIRSSHSRPLSRATIMLKSECLPTHDNEHNYGILCQRQFVDRVCEALLPPDATWLTVASSAETCPAKLSQTTHRCLVIPTKKEKGQRKDRTGYSLLVLQGAVASPLVLPPMARKQISWAGRLSHQSVFDVDGRLHNGGTGETESHDTRQVALLFREIWTELTALGGFNINHDSLRIDVQPKSLNAEFCETFSAVISDVERAEVKLACSASKVSHVVTLVVQSTPSSIAQSPTIQKIFWGISKNKDHFEDLNDRLNHNATGEVVLETTDPKTGLDSGNGGSKNVEYLDPVSRAYYKLAQVFEDDHLLSMFASLHSKNLPVDAQKKNMQSHGAGLDIGASPGGWTQVLHNNLGMQTVVAIDPGVLAGRVLALQGVRHVRADFSSEESIKVLAEHAPYSVIVCDACVSNANELLIKIAETFDSVSTLLKKSGDSNSNADALNRDIFTWPLCLVVTLKLPYKTHTSIARNLEKANDYIPDYLRRIASLGSSSERGSGGGDVVARYRICHLFANSTSERTLVATFHKK